MGTGLVGMVCHVVVTPVKNEIENLHLCIESMTKQTIRPTEWIIVDDFSTDGSRELIETAAKSYDWINMATIEVEGKRKRGANISRLINIGISRTLHDWSYFSKIDADIVLPSKYFERILSKFDEEEDLGIASGNCYEYGRREEGKVESVIEGHTRGALKTYRKECYIQIGGIKEIDGWDGLDNMTAQYHGWKTKNFTSILVDQMRPTGSLDGTISNFFSAGVKSHILCYSWAYLIAKSLAAMKRRPVLIGGLCIFIGFIGAKLMGTEKIKDRGLINFIRSSQRTRLLRIIGIGNR